MKKIMTVSLALAAATVLRADTSVTVTSVVQSEKDRSVAVTYTLTGGPAIITFAMTTNGVPVAQDDLRGAVGDVYCKVTDGTNRSFVWKPDNGAALAPKQMALACQVKAWSLSSPPDYAVFNLNDGTDVRFYETKGQFPIPFPSPAYKQQLLLMRRIPAAKVRWRMGALDAENGDHYTNEHPLHYVTLTKDFYIGVYEATDYQVNRFWSNAYDGGMRPCAGTNWPCYDQIRGKTYRWPKDKLDVDSTSIMGRIRAFFNNEWKFDLPTEAQWEFAARGGLSGNPYSNADVGNYAWRNNNSGSQRQEVGLKWPNNYGLYDVFGNVHECCRDFYGAFSGDEVTDPEGPTDETITTVVYKGGGYWDDWYQLRAARRSACERDKTGSYHGFRFCIPLE